MFVRNFPFLILRKSTVPRASLIGVIALTVTVLTGSTTTTFSKILSESLSPFSLLFISEFITLAFTIFSFGFINLIEEFLAIKKRDYFPILLVGVANSVLAPVLIFTGLRYTSAVNGELSLGSNILFMFIFAGLFLRENISRAHIVAAGTVFFGLVMVALRGFTSGFSPAPGDLLIVLGSLLYASGTIIFKLRLSALQPDVFLFCRGLVAITAFFLTAPFMETTLLSDLQGLPTMILIVLFAYGFFSRFLGLISFYEAIERMQIHFVSLFLPFSTIGSILFAHLYLGDAIEWFHIVGAISICSGSVILRLPTPHMNVEQVKTNLKSGVQTTAHHS